MTDGGGAGGAVSPEDAHDVAGFVALLRHLKDVSGLSYRQLEERAERRGEVLARSTIADVLRRDALPRPEVLAAFVRACGGGEAEARRWLAARERLATGQRPAAEPPTDENRPPPPAGWLSRRRAPLLGGVAAALALLGALGAWVVGVQGGDGTDTAGSASFDEGEVEIHPARAGELCLTEGLEHTGRYHSVIAAQQPCEGAVPPRTLLRQAGDGMYHIVWHHPRHGPGCLTLLDGGPADGMVEPWDDCREDRPSQRFLIEPAGGPDAGYRIRPEATGRCLGIRGDQATAAGAEVVQQPCDGSARQRFHIVPKTR